MLLFSRGLHYSITFEDVSCSVELYLNFICCYFVGDLMKILEIFNKESSKDIKPLDVAKLMNIGSSKKAVNSLLYFLKNKNLLTVKTGENNTDPRWSRHPTNTYTGIFISFLFM